MVPMSASIIPGNPHARNYEGFTWGWHRLGLSAIHVDDRKLTGKGVVVGLIDTGVCENHADLKFKVKDFVIVGPPAGLVTPSHAFDRHGHGTFTAGVRRCGQLRHPDWRSARR